MEQNPDFVLALEDNLLEEYERYGFHYDFDLNDASCDEFNKDRLSPASEFYERNGFHHDVYEDDEYDEYRLVPYEERAIFLPRWPQIRNRQQLIDHENKLKAIRVQKQLQQRRKRELFVRRIKSAFLERRRLPTECILYEYPRVGFELAIHRNCNLYMEVNFKDKSVDLLEM